MAANVSSRQPWSDVVSHCVLCLLTGRSVCGNTSWAIVSQRRMEFEYLGCQRNYLGSPAAARMYFPDLSFSGDLNP